MPVETLDGHDQILCRLDQLLQARDMTLTRLSELVGISLVNLSVLKNNRARAIRFSTLTAICGALHCEIGELFVLERTEATDDERVDAGTTAPITSSRLRGRSTRATP